MTGNENVPQEKKRNCERQLGTKFAKYLKKSVRFMACLILRGQIPERQMRLEETGHFSGFGQKVHLLVFSAADDWEEKAVPLRNVISRLFIK